MAVTQEKADKIAEEYAKVSFKDKTKPLLAIGYKPSYAKTLGHKLYSNIKVIEAIGRIKAKAERIFEHNYEKAVEMIEERIGWLNTKAKTGNVQAIQAQTALIRELDDITGLKQQNINITTDQQRELDEKESKEAKRIAKVLNIQELRESG